MAQNSGFRYCHGCWMPSACSQFVCSDSGQHLCTRATSRLWDPHLCFSAEASPGTPQACLFGKGHPQWPDLTPQWQPSVGLGRLPVGKSSCFPGPCWNILSCRTSTLQDRALVTTGGARTTARPYWLFSLPGSRSPLPHLHLSPCLRVYFRDKQSKKHVR